MQDKQKITVIDVYNKRVLDENPRDLVCDYVADQPLGVFEMPADDSEIPDE